MSKTTNHIINETDRRHPAETDDEQQRLINADLEHDYQYQQHLKSMTTIDQIKERISTGELTPDIRLASLVRECNTEPVDTATHPLMSRLVDLAVFGTETPLFNHGQYPAGIQAEHDAAMHHDWHMAYVAIRAAVYAEAARRWSNMIAA